MVRQVIAASGALIALVAFPLAPPAAADNDQVVLTQSGKQRCLVSTDNVPQGGGPMVTCQLTDGQPFPQAQWATMKNSSRLNLAVMRGSGEFLYDIGSVPGSGEDIILDNGQTQINGWTIQADDQRTWFTYDATGHGVSVSAADVRSY